MKQKFTSLLLAALMCLMGTSAMALSEVDGVYQIGSADDLVAFAAVVNGGIADANAALTASFDMAGQPWEGINAYTGTFDGQGFSVSNLAGPLFATTADGVVIKNLTLSGSITTSEEVEGFGAFVASNTGGVFTMEGCTNRTTVSALYAKYVGGLVGYLTLGGSSNITSCKNEAEISGLERVGGIVGHYYYDNSGNPLTMNDCSNSANITATSQMAGGIIGSMTGRLHVTGGFNSGNITCDNGDYAGGFFGYSTRYLKDIKHFSNTGDIIANNAVGGIVGFFYNTTVALYLTLEHCSNDGAVTARGSYAGGLVGRARGNSNYFEYHYCYNTGVISGLTAAAIAAESRRGTYTYCYNTGVISTDATGRALVCGGTGATLENCWNTGEMVVSDGEISGETLIQSSGTVKITKCYDFANIAMQPTHGAPEDYAPEWIADGHLCYFLNGNKLQDAKWFQTIGTDDHPVFDSTHGLVFPQGDGYASAFDDITELKAAMFEEMRKYAEEVIAYQGAIDSMLLSIADLDTLTERDAFISAFYSGKRAVVEESAKAYQKYIDAVEAVRTTADESNVSGTDMDLLYDYLDGDEAESEAFPNGAYFYIIDSKKLNDEQITEEIAFVQRLLDTAIRNGYKAGDEITKLMANADLSESPRFTGWEYEKSGSTFTTGGVTSIMTTAEAWNATFDMHQTLTGLANGVYELRVNAAFRPAANIYNTNVAAFVYANDNAANVITESEDVIYEADAQDSINCYITAGASNTDYEYINDETGELGYVPYGPLSCSFAFNGGRYENIIVANVTDGNLTVGLRLPGTGCAQDWMGFGNFRLYYQGEANEPTALEALQRTLDKLAARAQTQISYQGNSGAEYKSYPQFSQALRDSLQAEIDAIPSATTGEQRLQLIQRFTQTFQSIYSCKKAYVTMFDEIEDLYDRVYSLAGVYPGILVPAEEMEDALSKTIIPKWEDGLYSEEEAASMAELRSLSIYAYLDNIVPKQVDGIYQLSKPQDLLWLAANSSSTPIEACLVNDIDMSGETTFTSGKDFTGTLDGQGFTISNLPAPLFASTTGTVTIKNLTIAGALTTNEDVTDYAPLIGIHTYGTLTLDSVINKTTVEAPFGQKVGGLVGTLTQKATSPSTNAYITNCQNQANISAAANVGGIIGNYSDSGDAYSYLYVTDASNTGDITATGDNVGGIMGYTSSRIESKGGFNTGKITSVEGINAGGYMGQSARYVKAVYNFHNSGDVTAVNYAGGISGYIYYNALVYIIYNDNVNDGAITATNGLAGGILGYARAGSHDFTYTRCVNNGAIKGAVAGGLCGLSRRGTFNDCYNTGSVESDSIGRALIAETDVATLNRCWNIGQITLTAGEIADSLTLVRTTNNVTYNVGNYDLANVAYTPKYGRPEGYEDEWLTNGHFCYLLNENKGDTLYYQTLGEDPHPVFDKTHKVVSIDGNGQYVNAGGDGIAQPMANSQKPKAIYDLSGRRVAKPTRGLYIIGGCKVFVK